MPTCIEWCDKLGDLFHESVPHDTIAAVMSTVSVMDHHTYLLLTKRPERMKKEMESWYGHMTNGSTYKNLWLGVTVENQAEADRRIPILLQTPASKRFVSIEPMLGPVTLVNAGLKEVRKGTVGPRTWEKFDYLDNSRWTSGENDNKWIGSVKGGGLDWVICGGESGPHARPMHPDWVRGLRDQCKAAGVPFFFKNWGEWKPKNQGIPFHDCRWGTMDINGELFESATPWNGKTGKDSPIGEEIVYRVGKSRSGHLLDGQEHREIGR